MKNLFTFLLILACCLKAYSTRIYNNTLVTVTISGFDPCVEDIVIERGAILRITGTLQMGPGYKITVKPGGYLDVNGGTVTASSINGLWSGIIVEGDPSKSQPAGIYFTNDISFRSASAGLFQGMVRVTNGATISKANRAITLGIPDLTNNVRGVYSNGGGGTIIAEDSYFQDNQYYSIGFSGYRSYSANASKVTNCSFSFSTRFFSVNTSCITLVDNEFWNLYENTFAGYTNSQDYYGIKAFNSKINLENSYPRSSTVHFKDLMIAIDHRDQTSFVNHLTIANQNFVNCTVSICINYSDNISINNCKMTIDNNMQWWGDITSTWCNSASNVNIQDDTIISTNSNSNFVNSGRTSGIWIISSHTASDISKNLIQGTYKHGINAQSDNGGLGISCNTFSSIVSNDIFVNDQNNFFSQIKPVQGGASHPAGNEFSYVHTYTTSDIHQNAEAKNVTYYYANTGQQHPTNVSASVNPLNTSGTPTCYRPQALTIEDGMDGITEIESAIAELDPEADTEEIAALETEKQYYMYDIIQLYLTDTVDSAGSMADVIDYLNNTNTFFAKYQLANIYLNYQMLPDLDSLLGTLDSLPEYDYIIGQYEDFMQLQKSAAVYQWNDSFLQTLRSNITTIAEDSVQSWVTNRAKCWINYLNLTREITDPADSILLVPTYTWNYVLPDTLIPVDSVVTTGISVTAYPNPFTTTLNVDIDNDIDIARTFDITVFNSSAGIEVQGSITIAANSSDTKIFDVSALSSGTYYLRVVCNNMIVNQQHLVK